MKKLLIPILLLCMCATLGCTSETPPDASDTSAVGGSTSGDTAPSDTADGTATDVPVITDTLIVDGTSDFVITRPDVADELTVAATVKLRKAIAEQTGLTLTMGTDFYKPNNPNFSIPTCEILVGMTNRDVTAEFAEMIPRRNDWLIARKGAKVLILGGEKIEEAVDYFLENYVKDGNICIEDGACYVHLGEYRFSSLTLGGQPLSACTVCYESGNTLAENCAKSLAATLSEESGYSIGTKAIYALGTEAGEISFTFDYTLDPYTVVCSAEGGSLRVRCGIVGSPERALDMIYAELEKGAATGTLALDTVSFEIKEENGNMVIADEAYMQTLEEKQTDMKDAVLNSASEYEVGEGGTVYYFSAEGDDASDGLSPETPLKTLDKLASLALKSGDVVLFRRGDTFRGSVTMKTGVTYSAYGEGAKPILTTSRRNFAEPADWKETEYKNVWVYSGYLTNVGIVAFDHTGEIGKYDEIVGKRRIKGVDRFEGPQSMDEDLEVYSDLSTKKLYVYSEENPGTRFSSIEIGERGNVFSGGGNDVVIDNLHITVTGAHGVGTGGVKNLTVRNCVFNWIGGSILTGFAGGDTVGYGNAVEIYGSVDGFYVYNNWIYQIYDTGITHQFSETPTTPVNNHSNVEYYDNLIEYCHWSIEYYNASGGEGTTRKTSNVYVHDNYCRMGGYGWGGRTLTWTPMYGIGAQADVTENYVTENNIFENCLGYLVDLRGNRLTEGYTFTGNTYVQPYGYVFLNCEGEHKFDATAGAVIAEKLGETNAKLAFIMDSPFTVTP